MSVLDRIWDGFKQVATIEHRVDLLENRLERVQTAHDETRERLLRVEILLETARDMGRQRRLSGDEGKP